MAVENFSLPFNVHNVHQMPIRNRPSRLAQTPLAERFRFEVSEGVRPAEYFAPFKYLPVLLQDTTTEDFIVIPKGRIVSSVTTEDAQPSGGMIYPSGDGTIDTFRSQIDDSFKTSDIDNSYFGYDEYVTNLLVPANGGTISTVYYTANDTTALTPHISGGYAGAGEEFYLPVNYPVGVVYHDWYQDIRGKYLNYRMWPDGGHVLCDWYVEVPYVKTTAGAQSSTLGSGVTPVATNGDYTSYLANYPVNKKFTYLEVNMDTDTFKPGVWINSDLVGNYNIEGVSTKSIQTVGRLIGIDNRFPKSGLGDVQTYPGSRMPGTQTAGLPSFLYEFVVACQTLTGTVPTVEDVIGYVRAGFYGVARIQLHI